MSELNFCLVGDKEYLENNAIPLMRSIVYFHKNPVIHLISNSELNMNKFDVGCKVYNYKATLISHDYYSKNPILKHIKDEGLLKFNMFQVLPDIKVLYSDVDRICVNSYEDYINSTNDLAAQEEIWNWEYLPDDNWDKTQSIGVGYRLKSDSIWRYQSGMLCVDITKNRDLFDKAVEFVNKSPEENGLKYYNVSDCLIFNRIHPSYESRSQKCDFVTYIMEWKRFKNNFRREWDFLMNMVYEGPILGYHYAGPVKPWTPHSNVMFHEYWDKFNS